MLNSRESVSLRFRELLDKLGHNVPSFSKALQYSRPDKLYNIYNGIYYPSFEILSDITKYFDNVNVDYLITGRGSIFHSPNITCTLRQKSEKKCLPLIPYDGWAGLGSPNFCDEVIDEYYTIPDFKDADFLLRVKGDSMTPLLESGDLVACKKVCELCDDKKIHAIYTKSMGVLIKHILRDSMPSHLTFKSENNNYPEFNLPVSDIVDIALVVGSISLDRFSALK